MNSKFLQTNKKHTLISSLIGLAVCAVVFGILFKFTSWQSIVTTLLSANIFAVGLYILLSLIMSCLRTLRYTILLAASGSHPGSFRLFLVVLVRRCVVDIVPARLGEAVYVLLLKIKLGIGLGPATSSFAIAFVMDILALAPLLVLSVFSFSDNQTISSTMVLTVSATLLTGGLFVIWFLRPASEFAASFCKKREERPLARRLHVFFADLNRELIVCSRWKIMLPVFLLSILVRLAKYSALYVLFLGLLNGAGHSTANLPFGKVLVGLCSSEMAASLPFSGFLGFGAYEGTWAFVFSSLGFTKSVAIETGIAHHLITQFTGIIFGLIGLITLLSLRKETHKEH